MTDKHKPENMKPDNMKPDNMMPEHKKPLGPEFYKLLQELQAVDFALVELNLYLDTHPTDLKAIEQYNQLAMQRKELACAYEAKYGPLLHFGHSFSRYPWQWIETPWPWQV